MSELMKTQRDAGALRWKLLATASALALLASAYPFGEAKASDGDADQPILWVQLGGQLSRLQDSQEQFSPPFFANIPKAGQTSPYAMAFTKTDFASPLTLEKPPLYSIDEDAKISFQPEGSSWVLSASILYGRAKSKKYLHQQTNLKNPLLSRSSTDIVGVLRYAQTKTTYAEAHTIADFMAGKDVGLGMPGMNGSSVLSAGVRFVQFRSWSSVNVNADPDYTQHWVTSGGGINIAAPKYHHDYVAQTQSTRSFRGIGPAISWDASAPLTGDSPDGKISLDWGVNGAILFGRQKMVGHHQATSHFQSGLNIPPTFIPVTTHYTHVGNPSRSRSVVVPNLGGFAGISFRLADAKVSFGYRGDFFFGAMDGGIDTAKKENRGFYGPFANFSIGIGG